MITFTIYSKSLFFSDLQYIDNLYDMNKEQCSFFSMFLQSNECGGSYHMELCGLTRMVNFMKDIELDIGVLVTDRHLQIAKWISDNMPETLHCYDIWHVAKCKISNNSSCLLCKKKKFLL